MANKMKKGGTDIAPPVDRKVCQPGNEYPTNARPIGFLGSELEAVKREAAHGEFQYPAPAKPPDSGVKVTRFNE